MSGRGASRLAWSLAGLSLFMFAVNVALFVGSEWGEAGFWSTAGELLGFLPLLAFPVVGGLVAARRPGNSIGWICLTAGLFWMLIGLGEGYGVAFGSGPSLIVLDALTQWIWVPPVGLLGVYMILLFPDGKLPSRRWRPFAWFAGALMAVICVGFVFVPGPLEGHPGEINPLGVEGLAWVRDVAIYVILLLPVCILISALSLVVRYRHSRREVRQQIKWLALAAGFVGAIYFGGLLGQVLFVPESLEVGGREPLWAQILNHLILLAYAGVPVAVGIAVLKYRLYDIEIIVNRALVYGPLTVTLALVYVGGVVSLQGLLRALTGQGSQLAVVASTLVIAALFNPLRRWVQNFVDRRFYRGKYDAAKTLEVFSARLRDETDLDALGGDLVGVVEETMRPVHARLWLRPGVRGEER